ncbi:MAG: hypothetical protein JXA79_03665, partial [Deltaproteobacteria bacterium]|nr:hypothetical protein [Deltaproteobacteria bacterium]
RKYVMNEIKRRILCIFIFFGLVYSGGAVRDLCYVFASETKDKQQRGWHHKLAEYALTKQSIEYGQALYWHLDYNSFVVKVPTCLMIFDYYNDSPARHSVPPYYEKVAGKSDRSLFTGVLNVDEIKNENVVMFFSHEHPAELFLEALELRKKIENIHYVIPEEIYQIYKSQIETTEGEDISNPIEVVKPNKSFKIYGIDVQVMKAQYLLSPESNPRCSGVEFLVDTNNGVKIYHSGALTCHICTNTEAQDTSISKIPKTITKDTKKLIFQNKRLVEVDDVQADEYIFGDKTTERLGFALYTSSAPAKGNIVVWCTYSPNHYGPFGGGGGSPIWTTDQRNLAETKKPLGFRFEDWQEGQREDPEFTDWYYDRLKGNSSIVAWLRVLHKRAQSRYVNTGEHMDASWNVIQSDEGRVRGQCYFFNDSHSNHIVYSGGFMQPSGYPFVTEKVFKSKSLLE